jgi:hypothetical protein
MVTTPLQESQQGNKKDNSDIMTHISIYHSTLTTIIIITVIILYMNEKKVTT